MDRRSFLVSCSGLAAASALPAWVAGCAGPPGGFSVSAWRTLAAVQEHLLPSGGSAPGARDIHAEAFLRALLADPTLAPAERALLRDGGEALAKLAQELTGQPFVELPPQERERVLRRFETTADGPRWLGEMLGYLMEALLGDPVYGGNPGGSGWRWLAHNPGFPRPPAGKRYYLL